MNFLKAAAITAAIVAYIGLIAAITIPGCNMVYSGNMYGWGLVAVGFFLWMFPIIYAMSRC